MRNYRVTGIVIRRFNIYEADRIVTLLTKERGLIEARARGVRKIKAKLKGALELFNYSQVELAKGKEIDVITGAQIVEPFENFRKNLADTSVAFYLSEAVIGLLSEEEPQPLVFRLLLETLQELDQENIKDRKREILISHFLIKLLAVTGFKPELYQCLQCRSKIRKSGNVFDLAGGGLICSDCQSQSLNQRTVSDQAIKILRLLYQNGSRISRQIKAEDNYLSEAREILHRFLEYVLERELKSSRFLKEIRKEHAQVD